MATATISIPVANGRQYAGVGAAIPLVGNVNDTNLSKWTAQFDPDTEQKLHFFMLMPPNYLSGSMNIRLRWRANATTGDCVWKLYYSQFQPSGGTIPGGATTTTVTTTTDSIALDVNESVLSFTPAAQYAIAFTISRDAGAGGDTLTVVSELLEVLWEYTCDATITKQYIWIPANAFAIPSGSSATLSNLNLISSNNNYSYALSMSQNSYADAKFTVPSNFSSAMKWYVLSSQAGFQTYTFHLNMARIVVGGDSDPTLTAGGTSLSNSAISGYRSVRSDGNGSAPGTIPITPVAGDEILLRLVREASGSGSDGVLGVLLEYVSTQKNPGIIRLDPISAALPTSNPAVLAQVDDTNTSKLVAQYADGSDLIADFIGFLPSIYSSGGTLRVRWRSSASSGNGYFQVDHASPASGAASDPALTAGTPTAYATAGANKVNEFTVDISSGLAASDLLYVRVTRLASNSLDTLSASVDVLEVVFEANVS